MCLKIQRFAVGSQDYAISRGYTYGTNTGLQINLSYIYNYARQAVLNRLGHISCDILSFAEF